MSAQHTYEFGVHDLGRGCFAYLQPDGGWGLSNSGLVTDSGEALLVDTMFDGPHTQAMLDAYGRVNPARIGTLVNTHQNGDHWFGNALVKNAEIIATERAAEAMAHEPPGGIAQQRVVRRGDDLEGRLSRRCQAGSAGRPPCRRHRR